MYQYIQNNISNNNNANIFEILSNIYKTILFYDEDKKLASKKQ